METATTPQTEEATPRRLDFFARYLSLWVALCMASGVALGTLLPGVTDGLRRLEFGESSQINIPIAVLLWLMIYPMMLRIDLASVLEVRRRPRGILITLFVNWLVKPFSMAALGWLFFKHVFQPWIGAELADQYVVLPHRRRPGLHARAGLAQRPADAGALRPDRDVPGERRQQPHGAGRGSALLGWDLHRGAPGTR
jgi:hypothetical protein